MKTIFFFASFLISSIIILSGCDNNQPTDNDNNEPPVYGEIEGYISNEKDNKYIENAIIRTVPPSSSVTSGYTGYYYIDNLVPGLYTVIVEKSGYYTNRVSVNVIGDKTTTAKIQLKAIVDYNNPPEKPLLTFPIDKDIVSKDNIMFQWSCTDPDSDPLTYELYLGLDIYHMYSKGTNIKESRLIIDSLKDSTTYYWKVIAKDYYGATTESDIGLFETSGKSGHINKADLVAYYPFNGNANDFSGNKLDGTIYNAVLSDDRNGADKQAYYFNGFNSNIEIKNNSLLTLNNDFTITAWIKPDNNPGNDYQTHIDIVSTCCCQSEFGYYLGIIKERKIEFWSSNTGYNDFIGSSVVLSPNTWSHIAVRFIKNSDNNIGVAELFVNGSIISTKSIHQPAPILYNNLLIGGRAGSRNYFSGSIDEVYIYNKALTDQEIIALAKK